MSKLGEWLAWMLNRHFPPLAIHRELQNAKSDVKANQRWAYEEALRVCHAFQPYWDLAGQHILDIGSGLGGKLPFYVTKAGAETVTGIDINAQSVYIARRYITSLGLACGKKEVVRLAVSNAAALPFPDNCFDAIVSINVFEHIAHLRRALCECYRVLKPDGLAYLYLPPYYSPWGPHLENWIHFPWPHLLFSEKTLMRVAAREDARLRLSERFVEAARIDWQNSGDRIPDVNRVTLWRFRRMVRQVGFSIVQLKLLPVGYDYLKAGPPFKWLVLWLLKGIAQIPLLQEVVVTKMVYVLRKAA